MPTSTERVLVLVAVCRFVGDRPPTPKKLRGQPPPLPHCATTPVTDMKSMVSLVKTVVLVKTNALAILKRIQFYVGFEELNGIFTEFY